MNFGEGERRRTIRTSSENLTKGAKIEAFWRVQRNHLWLCGCGEDLRRRTVRTSSKDLPKQAKKTTLRLDGIRFLLGIRIDRFITAKIVSDDEWNPYIFYSAIFPHITTNPRRQNATPQPIVLKRQFQATKNPTLNQRSGFQLSSSRKFSADSYSPLKGRRATSLALLIAVERSL